MDHDLYLKIFKRSANKLDKKLLSKNKLEVNVGIILNSVFLKIYKKEWSSDKKDPMNAEARIFFSVWINDKAINEKKLFYNIHALKLRKLKGHSISSREFAIQFRQRFEKVKHKWENASVSYGPLTLMEGWIKLEDKNLESRITALALKFSEISHLVDETLELFKNVEYNKKSKLITNSIKQIPMAGNTSKLKDGTLCKVIAGTHTGKSGIVRDINTSKTGHITITVVQVNGVRFKTLAKNVELT